MDLDEDGDDDETDLDPTYPPWVQNVMHLGVSAYMKGEEGDAQGQIDDLELYNRIVAKNRLLDIRTTGRGPVRMKRADELPGSSPGAITIIANVTSS